MFTAIRRLNRADALFVEVPSLVASLALAETCYKFHSFILEGVAFLLTWFVFGGLLALVRKGIMDRRSRS